jgi:nicotinamidase-related amidase|tara:strand:+ start:3481 stop:4101 length:621 start_codon:yes stop_codon:yes gene_type:complete
MIEKFDETTALLLVDVQKGVNEVKYYGGPSGKRNNHSAEENMRCLLAEWRRLGKRVAFTRHNSREINSPLKLELETGNQIEGLEINGPDIVVEKDVNSGFIGTSLELELRRSGINRLVVMGFYTNYCIETTVRMAGNLGFDTYLVHDACAAVNTLGHDGEYYEPDLVHNMSIASLHGEFCTAISKEVAMGLCLENCVDLERVQGNE